MTEPANAAAVFVPAEVGDTVEDDAAAGLDEFEAPVEAEPELALELQAAAPTTRTAPMAAIRHLAPALIR